MFIIELSPMKEVNSLIVDFFRKKHMKEISWKKELESTELQTELISKTFNSELVLKYKIEIKYQRRFLRTFMLYLDEIGAETCGAAYKALCHLSTGREEDYYYVFYPIFELDKLDSLSKLNTIILKENVNIISGGTTGLVTWQAAQALAEWALRTSLDKKTILELGSGAGMSGLVVASSTSCDRYIFTDCHANVLSLLKENVELNSDETSKENKPGIDIIYQGKVGDCRVEVRKLDWESTTEGICRNFGSVETIFAADVVYDPELFEPLLKSIKIFLKNGTKSAILAFTQRDEVTVESFTKKLGRGEIIESAGCLISCVCGIPRCTVYSTCRGSMELQTKWLETLKPNYLSWEILPIIHIVDITVKPE